MSFTPLRWYNDSEPALEADNLNRIEKGIKDAHDELATLDGSLTALTDRVDDMGDDVTSLGTRVTSAEASITSLGTRVDSMSYTYGTSSGWQYKKWDDGTCEAWYSMPSAVSVTPTAWVSPIYYADRTEAIPSGIFTSISHVNMSTKTSQWWHTGAWATSVTSISYRILKPGAGATNFAASFHVIGKWK